jgi:glutathione S-transferase
MLFHIVDRATWEAARAAGVYRPASLTSEGFIHLSTAEQWPRTRERFYADVPDLVLLEIDETLLSAEIRYERADDDDFPHLFGPLDIDAVVNVRRLT